MRLFEDVSSRVDDPYLARALVLAEKGRGATAPNPHVGCVIVRDGRIVGEGYHPRAGEPHAEVWALKEAGTQAAGADVYLTLEPCSHFGKTPPCTDALIAARVRSVTIGMRDVNPEAAGGAEALRAAGIEATFASDPEPFAELNAGWLKRIAIGLPRVVVKLGMSLDAHLAFVPGTRAAITGPWGAKLTRTLRAGADAVLVGAATVSADDPALTVRDSGGELAPVQPLRIVLVRDTVPPADSQLFTDDAAPTLVLAADMAPQSVLDALPPDVEVMRYFAADGLSGALRAIALCGINDLLVEPGPKLFSALWSERLIDELVTVCAGGMAGPDAPPLFVPPPAPQEVDLPSEAVPESALGSGRVLEREFAPVEAGIVGDVAVTVWAPVSQEPVSA